MRIQATIRACDARRDFATALASEIHAAAPELRTKIFWSSGPIGRPAACANFNRTIQYVAAVGCEWWLCLEDDQVIASDFVSRLGDIVELADCHHSPMVYLADREIEHCPTQESRGYRYHFLFMAVPGAHGLLIRGEFVPRIAALAASRAVFAQDGIIWDALAGRTSHTSHPIQIVSPALMHHLEGPSTLGHVAQSTIPA